VRLKVLDRLGFDFRLTELMKKIAVSDSDSRVFQITLAKYDAHW